jgi:hypothetical protein
VVHTLVFEVAVQNEVVVAQLVLLAALRLTWLRVSARVTIKGYFSGCSSTAHMTSTSDASVLFAQPSE